MEWPLRIVAFTLSVISGTVIYSEMRLPDPRWLAILTALVFGLWFGFLGIMGRSPYFRKFPGDKTRRL
jgi:hypothetical protein